jgi:putative Mg2+ transporter-C (MgtC) family protein
MLVALGASLFTVLSLVAFPNSETARVAAQIVVGIGFLGAGVIILYSGTLVVGITTAATLWSSAAVGMAAGAGYFRLAGSATFIILFVLIALPYFEERAVFKFSTRRMYLFIQGDTERDLSSQILQLLKSRQVSGEILRIEECREQGCLRSYLYRVKIPAKVSIYTLVEEISSIDGVLSAKIEE